MRKLILLLVLVVSVALFISDRLDRMIREVEEIKWITPKPIPKLVRKPELPQRIGEKIIYEVKLGNIRLGEAEFERLPNTVLDGKTANLVSFKTKVINFADNEIIYSDPETFLPLKVERDISSWPKKEKITEEYDQKNYNLTITKHLKNKKEQIVFKRDGPIQNAIMLPYYVRLVAKLDLGWTFKANLPTQSFEIKLVNLEEVKIPAGTFKSYHFTSSPDRFEIWISADANKIPLKIRGSGGIDYIMSMKEYTLPGK